MGVFLDERVEGFGIVARNGHLVSSLDQPQSEAPGREERDEKMQIAAGLQFGRARQLQVQDLCPFDIDEERNAGESIRLVLVAQRETVGAISICTERQARERTILGVGVFPYPEQPWLVERIILAADWNRRSLECPRDAGTRDRQEQSGCGRSDPEPDPDPDNTGQGPLRCFSTHCRSSR